jgi:hypothetical protein
MGAARRLLLERIPLKVADGTVTLIVSTHDGRQ